MTSAEVQALLLTPVLSMAAPAQVNTLEALGQALTACFHAPDGSAGSQITVLVTLRRDGGVQGKPRITFSHLIGSDEAKRAFVEAALSSLRACTPVALTPALGGAIAGRPMTIRYVGGGPAQAI